MSNVPLARRPRYLSLSSLRLSLNFINISFTLLVFVPSFQSAHKQLCASVRALVAPRTRHASLLALELVGLQFLVFFFLQIRFCFNSSVHCGSGVLVCYLFRQPSFRLFRRSSSLALDVARGIPERSVSIVFSNRTGLPHTHTHTSFLQLLPRTKRNCACEWENNEL